MFSSEHISNPMVTVAGCSSRVVPRSIHQLITDGDEQAQKVDAAPAIPAAVAYTPSTVHHRGPAPS